MTMIRVNHANQTEKKVSQSPSGQKIMQELQQQLNAMKLTTKEITSDSGRIRCYVNDLVKPYQLRVDVYNHSTDPNRITLNVCVDQFNKPNQVLGSLTLSTRDIDHLIRTLVKFVACVSGKSHQTH